MKTSNAGSGLVCIPNTTKVASEDKEEEKQISTTSTCHHGKVGLRGPHVSDLGVFLRLIGPDNPLKSWHETTGDKFPTALPPPQHDHIYVPA